MSFLVYFLAINLIVIIQDIKYNRNGKVREADAFLVELGGQKFLQVEGRYIDSVGNFRKVGSGEVIKQSNTDTKANMKAYNDAVRNENSVFDLKDAQNNPLIHIFTSGMHHVHQSHLTYLLNFAKFAMRLFPAPLVRDGDCVSSSYK